MERFEIRDVVIDENYAEGKALKKVLDKFTLPVNTDEAKHIVRLGTADLENVTVLSSGKYVISAQTLPGYFDKKIWAR